METNFTKRVKAGTRIYYFDVHTDNKGQRYMTITEMPVANVKGDKKRHCVFVHSDHIDDFLEALDEATKHI